MVRTPLSTSIRDHRSAGERVPIGFWLFLVLSIVIFMLSRAGHPWVSTVRAEVASAATPMMKVLELPIDLYDLTTDWAAEIFAVRDENRRLQSEVEELRKWRGEAEHLAREIEDLRDLLNARTGAARTLATARVISATGGPYVRSLLIDGGRDRGISPDMAVVDESGLVGRTILVGALASRVLLVTDLNSRIPVRIERTGQNGIALGRNDNFLDLGFLPLDADVIVGDLILTSGDGGIFPQGLPVGSVTRVEAQTALVEPVARFGALDFVQVLDFDTSDLEPRANQEPDEAVIPEAEGSQDTGDTGTLEAAEDDTPALPEDDGGQ